MIDAGLAERQFGIVRDLSLRNPDLAECLKALWASEPLSPDRDALRAFALTALGVKPAHYEAWYRRAWWGMYAGILIRQRMFKGRGDEVLRLVEPEPGFEAVRSALSGGRGAILLSAHLGLGYVPPQALKIQSTPRRPPLPSMTNVGPTSRIHASSVVISTTRTSGGSRPRALSNCRSETAIVTGSPPCAIAVATATNSAWTGFAPSRHVSWRSGQIIQQPSCGSNSPGMRNPSAAGVVVWVSLT